MTDLQWMGLVLLVGWIAWVARVVQILHRRQQQDMDTYTTTDEEDRRRQALGYATDLDTWRQIERQPGIRRTGRR